MSSNAGKKKDRSEANEVKELLLIAKGAGLVSEDLDEEVHETKASEAADINNGDIDVQIKYLYECFGKEATKDVLMKIVRAKAEASAAKGET